MRKVGNTLENKDIALLAIASALDQGLSPIQLQKSLFLVGRSGLPGLPSSFYDFFPYNYGPFHPNVYHDADALVEEAMVRLVAVPAHTWSQYVATPAGQERAKAISQTSKELAVYVQQVVDWVRNLAFTELLRAIYAKYPEFRENSVFQS